MGENRSMPLGYSTYHEHSRDEPPKDCNEEKGTNNRVELVSYVVVECEVRQPCCQCHDEYLADENNTTGNVSYCGDASSISDIVWGKERL